MADITGLRVYRKHIKLESYCIFERYCLATLTDTQ